MQPASPISERLRTIRRRVTVGVLATFVAAWLAVAAFGKGGGQSSSGGSGSSAASSSSGSQAAPSDGGDSGGAGPSDDGAYSGRDDGYGDDSQFQSPPQSDGSGSGSNAPAPLTSSQS